MNLFHIPGLLLDETAADDNTTRGHDFGRRYGSDPANARWLGHRAVRARRPALPRWRLPAARREPTAMSIWTELLFMHGHVASVEALAALGPAAVVPTAPEPAAAPAGAGAQTSAKPFHAIIGPCAPTP